ncbi:MAG TPA: peptidase domain-containing ABC transporter [Thermoanaerobaculia bacterium]|nr:peptidase domain-containing ABC transporter [Thermoanaerobaculia bacterium]
MAEPAPKSSTQTGTHGRFPALRRLGLGSRRRIPAVQQTTTMDCGAACLTMVLGYYGKQLPLAEVRKITGSGRDATNAEALLEAGRWFGLRGRGVRADTVEALGAIEPGAILHWRFNHFVVLDRLKSDGLHIVDPAGGRRVVSHQEARRSFTGVALLFEPAEGFAPLAAGAQGKGLQRYLQPLLARRGPLSRVLATSVLVQLFALAVPLLIGVLVDRVVPQQDVSLLAVLAAGLAGLVGFNLLAVLIRAHLLLELRTRLDAQLTLDFVDHLVGLPFAFFQERSAGDLILRMNSNATVREILTSGALSTVLDGILVSLYLVVLFVASAKMGLLVLGLALLRIVLLLATRRRQKDLMSRSLETQSSSQSYQVQMLAGMETLKASGSEHRAIEHWSNLFVDTLNISLARGRLSAMVDALLAGLGMASPLAVLLYGARLVFAGELSLGEMLALNALAAGFLTPLTQLVTTAFQFQLLDSYLERIEDVMQTPREQEPGSPGAGRPAARLRGGIKLEHVSFRYGPASPLVVSDVSVDISPGSFVAVVGRSGAGKSTLANLLVGLYQPSEGRILFDDLDLTELNLQSVRSQLGVVPQHPYLFGQSIRANISLADPTLPLARVVEAARLAHIHDEILAMPLSYDTLLADGGSSLSGGQRQRLALARALVRRPAILLLDEATSALDGMTESAIQRELAQLRSTRIVVAHRLSTIRDADLILVMDQGGIVERGTHDELVARGGAYAELVAQQVKRTDGVQVG